MLLLQKFQNVKFFCSEKDVIESLVMKGYAVFSHANMEKSFSPGIGEQLSILQEIS